MTSVDTAQVLMSLSEYLYSLSLSLSLSALALRQLLLPLWLRLFSPPPSPPPPPPLLQMQVVGWERVLLVFSQLATARTDCMCLSCHQNNSSELSLKLKYLILGQ